MENSWRSAHLDKQESTTDQGVTLLLGAGCGPDPGEDPDPDPLSEIIIIFTFAVSSCTTFVRHTGVNFRLKSLIFTF